MGSVSSLISSHGLNSKHCRTSEHKLKKGPHSKKTGRSLDGVLRYGFSQDPITATNNNSKGGVFRSGKNEDFYYIKVSRKPKSSHHRNTPADDREGGTDDVDTNRGQTPSDLVHQSSELEKSVDKALIRPTAFKPVHPKSNSSMETHHSLNTILGRKFSPPEKSKEVPEHNQDVGLGTLSDSGHNSMSSLPTHSTGGSSLLDSTGTSTGHLVRYSGSSQNMSPSQHLHGTGTNGSTWISGSSGINGINIMSTRASSILDENVSAAINLNRDIAAAASPFQPQLGLFPDPAGPTKSKSTTPTPDVGCIRSPITTDESLIQQLERKLQERESELQELQVCFDDKEADTCQLFEEKQRYCAEEMEVLKQRCSTKIRQASQRAQKTQQLLQLQVIQLQQDKERLQEEVDQLSHDRENAETRLRNYESQKIQLTPTLEEMQWEVCQKTGEISLLKQQLKDSQAEVGHKLSEIVALKASLREANSKMDDVEKKNKEQEEALHTRCTEVEVCQNELQRKKNEANLLREKVGRLETDIKGMKQDLTLAKEEQVKLLSSRATLEEEHLQLQIAKAKMEVFGGNRAKMRDQEVPGECGLLTDEKGRTGDTDSLQTEVERLRSELLDEKQKKDKMVSGFQLERQTWNKEKDKVIRYQKQLQYNYLQMHKKNQDLEKILRELTAEMDSRPELDIEVQSPPIRYNSMVVTDMRF
ncbi:leucine zipper putative tumor suppressor 1 isoform X2 [Denticeps clupeoides]|uniref:Leucine zipper tumor suppressor 1 n=2 Tax=Denticeps clupeoides TaxID=299321 RepID=A0AAY4DB62_9TELE|nr:leucine zipper putative tumor suppressor 1 isoform X2 [Denticeps clupeoides]XP_028853016.1 leucine zipper putative tumor suppressor 1 isoform X2 [Denticeps clupeoides]